MNRKLLVVTATLFVFSAVQAQEFKIGYTYIDFIVFNMPEMQTINSELTTFRGQLDTQIKAKETTLQAKLGEAQQLAQQNASATLLQEKQNELQKLQKEYQTYATQAQQSLAAKERDLMNPVFTKVQQAIEEVRKEKEFAIIFNMKTASGEGIVLAAEEALNITKFVFDKLGIVMPEQPTPTTPPAAPAGGGN